MAERRQVSVYRYFHRNPVYLQGFKDFADLQKVEKDAYAKFDEKSAAYDHASEEDRPAIEEAMNELQKELDDILARSESVVALANEIAFTDFFRADALRRLLIAAMIAAVGIAVFAWGSNPAPPVPTVGLELRRVNLSDSNLSGANLEHADLEKANLTRANLSGTDLRGADIVGAILDGAIWHHTICPDGLVSDDVGGSCANHLQP